MPVTGTVRLKPGKEGMGSSKMQIGGVRSPAKLPPGTGSNGPPPRRTDIRRKRG